ncbi:sigma-70 family RNA polymerase sigma factor [Leisingera sp. NJS204]|uniref:sigma-70 family RNA polymerase sigma factor n=1 Tax=Leisingera sp. NJS204 TaxID=2508307 RepID=UPI0010108601|nr:sigma-70 family RNA polymerase sigma factor [Leisingera sp. NJS204]QAX28379.1 sigma-70 family RNA polymerase sigma factor [Leisingera sp. NJS204]
MPNHPRPRVCEALIEELVSHRRLHLCSALKLVGSLDAAEDVIQNTALKCLSFKPGSLPDRPRPYVARMVRNAAIDYLRKSRREIPTDFEDEGQLAAAGVTPLCGRARLESKQALQAVVQSLADSTPRNRDVFLRHRLAGVLQKEIAEELQVSRALINVIVRNVQQRCADGLKGAS